MSLNDQQPPWGRKKKPQTPEDLVAQLIKKIQDFFSDDKKTGSNEPPHPDQPRETRPANPLASIGKIIAIVALILIAQGVYSSFYKIAPSEVGVVLRLGKYASTKPSGLHFKIPYIDHLYKVDVEQIRKEEFGFRSRFPGQQPTFSRKGYDVESLMLTADKNVINVAWIVQYRVGDPYSFLFLVKDVRQAVRDISESVTRRIVGNMDFDYVLSNRDLLAASVKQELQIELNNLFGTSLPGIKIGTVQFQDINPPDKVKPAFNEVNEADQDMKRLVNEAQETYNRVIPKARGNAKKIVEEARGYAFTRVNESKGETQRFVDILKEYRLAPDVTRKRIYLETMSKVLPQVKDIYIIDRDQSGPVPFLNLGGAAGLPIQPQSK
ncbi:FtsH protease activity modulator HflK [Desulfotalea psychrophila]|uniref:Protein HflK n=1 Tax=Desulfotalea psychrophila (strain LSv54 / DSM 12343) TaxID=177439 RepID=Q6APA3_DESPS|nr:FtsH protease activity modulator HflK [Desulfotalea psychrophila]CAG35821.1 probable lambda CII stability-governing protein (HflK) [Desulfotalea psychrophila LSv54]